MAFYTVLIVFSYVFYCLVTIYGMGGGEENQSGEA